MMSNILQTYEHRFSFRWSPTERFTSGSFQVIVSSYLNGFLNSLFEKICTLETNLNGDVDTKLAAQNSSWNRLSKILVSFLKTTYRGVHLQKLRLPGNFRVYLEHLLYGQMLLKLQPEERLQVSATISAQGCYPFPGLLKN